MRALALFTLVTSLAIAGSAEAKVTVFLERDGHVSTTRGGDSIEIPRYGGSDREWRWITGCVETHFAPFAIDVVTRRPARGDYITAVVGGRASQLGLDDRSVNGIGPYNGGVIPNAVVHIFSKVGTGEHDVKNLCGVIVHEVGHSLGLEHTFKCGDIMSYFHDRCGPERLLDVESPCGEYRARICATGKRTQNSYRRLGALVGYRQVEPDDDPDDTWSDDEEDAEEPAEDDDTWSDDTWSDDEAPNAAPNPAPERGSTQHGCGGHKRQWRRVYIIRWQRR